MSNDPQDTAEALDEDVVDTADDLTGDEYGDGLPDYPPDRPQGVNTVGVTAIEEDAGESFEERTWREDPDPAYEAAAGDPDRGDVGQIVDADATTVDHESQQVAHAEPGTTTTSAEEAAMHLEPDDG